MADRKQFLGVRSPSPELLTLLASARQREVSEAELKEQRISFAFGNAMNTEEITKDSVRHTSNNIRLRV